MTPTSAIHDLITRQVRRCYDTIEAHPDFEVAAADQIVFAPAVRDLLAAAEAVTALRDLHQRYAWNETSEVVVCRACRQSWPCETVKVLDAQQVTA